MNGKYLAAAAFACLLMSCGSGKNSVAVVDFSGEWNIVEVNGEKVSAENTPFLGFDNAEHRLYGNAGCNRLMGTFNLDTLNAGKISFGQVGATRMMCPDMKVEQSVLEALNKVAGYEEVGEGVSLNDADGKSVILLQKRDVKEVSIKDLEGTWQIMTVNGTEIGKTEKTPQLTFDLAEKRVYGNASCNTINGGFSQEEGKPSSLQFSQMISTMMACPDMDTERNILDALNKVRSFEVKENGTVSLLGEDGSELLTLKKLAAAEVEA